MKAGFLAFLSFVAALGGILFGYGTAVISGTIAAVGEQFRLDAMAKGWYVGCALVGSIAGVAVAGWLSDRFGRKPTMLFSSVLFSVSAIGCAFCMGFTDLAGLHLRDLAGEDARRAAASSRPPYRPLVGRFR